MSLRALKPLVGLAFVLAAAAACQNGVAQMDTAPQPAARTDAEYCQQLVFLYRRYISGNYVRNRPGDSDVTSNYAVAQCEAGNPAGIPVLERRLQNNGFTLPARN
jgi:hypothetical protein